MFVTIRIVKFENHKDLSSPIEFQEFVTLSKGEEASFGRSRSCTTRVPDDFTSSVHCKVKFTGSELLIKDLESKNGTKINGLKIGEITRLFIQDMIVIGETFLHIDEDRSSSDAVKVLIRPDDGSINAKFIKDYQQMTAPDQSNDNDF